LVVDATPANVPDIKELLPLVESIEPVVASRGDPSGDPRSYMATGRMTPRSIGRRYGNAASCPNWRGGTRSMEAAWGRSVGWWNSFSPGCTVSANYDW
jgi:hypothetical protein